MTTLLRTDEARFADVPDFAYPPHRVDVGPGTMAYVEAGRGPPVLCLHGEPTWGFLYRTMMPTLAAHGRVVVPDLLGFGRSDKFTDPREYSYALHRDAVARFIERLDLRDITLVCQDWGGLLGLPAAVAMPERFARLVIMNTGLPDGTHPMPPEWLRFKAFVERTPDLPIGMLVSRACRTELPKDVIAAYEAPFPDAASKAGARAFPSLVPITADMPGADVMRATKAALRSWTKPAFVCFSDSDPITTPAAPLFLELIPSARKEPETWIRGAGHLLQEDAGEETASHIAAFIQRRPPH